MREQLLEKQQELLVARRDAEQQQMDLLRATKDCDVSKTEAKEFMQALEELAVSYDEQKKLVDAKMVEIDELSVENTANRVCHGSW